MQFRRQSNGQIITLEPGSLLGTGGEARVYSVAKDSQLVAKVYHRPSLTSSNKLAVMLANPPDDSASGEGLKSIAWPVDLLLPVDGSQEAVGYLMPRVAGMRRIADFYNPKIRRQYSPLFNYLYLHRTARNLSAAMHNLHARGYLIGDVNESNILVSETALVMLVDTDSFQVRDEQSGQVFRCGVGKPEFTPPELQGQSLDGVLRLPEHDLFGLAVLIFQLLMEGAHPFAGVYHGEGEPPTYEARISSGYFPYGRKAVPFTPTPIAPRFETLNPNVQRLFVRCFEEGHENPKARPAAIEWRETLTEGENFLVACRANEQHRYSNHLRFCPWCERAKLLNGRDPFPSRRVVQRGQHVYVSSPSPNTTTQPVSATPLPTTVQMQRKVNYRKKAGAGTLAFLILFSFSSLIRVYFTETNKPIGIFKPISELPSPVRLSKPADDIFHDIGLNMIWLPKGEFLMGSNKAEDVEGDEYSVHLVKLSPFYISKYEVTQEQWQAVATLPKVRIDLPPNPSEFLGYNLPVERVNWEEAEEFCQRLSLATGKLYRLPTEAEWEYACRANRAVSEDDSLNETAWYFRNSDNKTHPVGKKKPNAWGLYDMQGNVGEWCQDWYNNHYYTQSPSTDPKGPNSGSLRVMRGGGWYFTESNCQVYFRNGYNPDNHSDFLGFRLAMSLR